MRTGLLFACLATAAALSAGCSSSSSAANKPPVIDDVQAPDTASKGSSGNYEMTITVSCHDDDGTIAKARIEIAGFANNEIKTPAQSTFKSVPVQLQIDGKAPAGKLDYTLVVVDDQGAETSKTLSVTLK